MSADRVIRIMCPNLKCRAVLGVPPEARGKRVRCRGCGTNIQIPTSEPTKSVEGADEDQTKVA